MRNSVAGPIISPPRTHNAPPWRTTKQREMHDAYSVGDGGSANEMDHGLIG